MINKNLKIALFSFAALVVISLVYLVFAFIFNIWPFYNEDFSQEITVGKAEAIRPSATCACVCSTLTALNKAEDQRQAAWARAAAARAVEEEEASNGNFRKKWALAKASSNRASHDARRWADEARELKPGIEKEMSQLAKLAEPNTVIVRGCGTGVSS